jgi:hypothetical protein
MKIFLEHLQPVKTVLITLIYFFATFAVIAQTTYTYSGTGEWTNTANWAPSYPGIETSNQEGIRIDGSLTIPSGLSIIIRGELSINGEIEISNGGILTTNFDFSLETIQLTSINGTINNYGTLTCFGRLVNSGEINNTGVFSIDQLDARFFNNGTVNNTGTFAVTNQALFSLSIGGVFINNGILDGTNAIFNWADPTSVLSGNNINHIAGFRNYGILSPGAELINSIGVYTFNSYLTFENNLTALNIELENTTTFDKVAGSSTVNLNGTLNVSLINGFTPTIGDTFTILTANTVSGAFTTTNLPAGFIWDITYNASDVMLEVTSVLSTLDFEISQFKLYPNPASNEFTIELGNSTTLEKVNIFNNIGQLVLSSNESRIKTTSLAKGIYLVKVTTNEGTSAKKIIVE